MTKMEQLQQMTDEGSWIVLFGGAGVFAESGVPDFRSVDDLCHQPLRYPPEEMLGHSFYVRHTTEFFDFYHKEVSHLNAQSNAAHRKLAELERAEKLSAIVAQNIDGLHQGAGSRRVYEPYGSIHHNYCQKCRREYDAELILHDGGIPTCIHDDTTKPDAVLYEGRPDQDVINGAVMATRETDILITGGTPLAIYPIAGLTHYSGDSRLVVINRPSTPTDQSATLMISGPTGGIFSRMEITEI